MLLACIPRMRDITDRTTLSKSRGSLTRRGQPDSAQQFLYPAESFVAGYREFSSHSQPLFPHNPFHHGDFTEVRKPVGENRVFPAKAGDLRAFFSQD